jgi:hypothetical protein
MKLTVASCLQFIYPNMAIAMGMDAMDKLRTLYNDLCRVLGRTADIVLLHPKVASYDCDLAEWEFYKKAEERFWGVVAGYSCGKKSGSIKSRIKLLDMEEFDSLLARVRADAVKGLEGDEEPSEEWRNTYAAVRAVLASGQPEVWVQKVGCEPIYFGLSATFLGMWYWTCHISGYRSAPDQEDKADVLSIVNRIRALGFIPAFRLDQAATGIALVPNFNEICVARAEKWREIATRASANAAGWGEVAELAIVE